MISAFNPALIGGFQGNKGGNRPDPSQMSDKLDTDKSGSLTASELEGGRFGARLLDAFADIDADGDAALTSEELWTFRAENGPPPPPPGGGQARG